MIIQGKLGGLVFELDKIPAVCAEDFGRISRDQKTVRSSPTKAVRTAPIVFRGASGGGGPENNKEFPKIMFRQNSPIRRGKLILSLLLVTPV